MDFSVQVAGRAVGQFLGADARLAVALLDRLWLVIVTGIASERLVFREVTGGAVRFLFSPVIKREGVLLQQPWLPGLAGVAVLAFLPEEPGVQFGLLVACRACPRCAAELLLRVAALAGQVGMHAVQGKDARMVECVHAVDPVVTGDTIRSKLFLVLLHEFAVVLCVTLRAGRRCNRAGRAGMARGAGEGFLVVTERVARQDEARLSVVEGGTFKGGGFPTPIRMTGRAIQAEHPGMLWRLRMASGAFRVGLVVTGPGMAGLAFQNGVLPAERQASLFMVKLFQGGGGWIKIATFVFGMAGGAAVCRFQAPMSSVFFIDLIGYFLMTIQAQRGLLSLQRLVAEAAVGFKVCVRLVSRQLYSGLALCADLPWVKDCPAVEQHGQSEACEEEDCKGYRKGRNDRRPR